MAGLAVARCDAAEFPMAYGRARLVSGSNWMNASSKDFRVGA